MSYDLYLVTSRDSSVTPAAIGEFLSARSGYTIEGAQAHYENEKTGVYFVIDLEEDEPDDGVVSVGVVAINYCRPSFFIREVEQELTSLIQAFGLSVFDPQDGMSDGDYSPERFVAGWTQVNRMSCLSIVRDDVKTLPGAVLNRVWEWNCGVAALQHQLDKTHDAFVPRVMLLRLGDRVVTAAVWPDGIPIAVPEVEYLLVMRDELAPRRLFGRKKDQGLVAMAEALPLFESHRSAREGSLFILDYVTPPKDVKSFVKALKLQTAGFEGLAMDEVIDEEFFVAEA